MEFVMACRCYLRQSSQDNQICLNLSTKSKTFFFLSGWIDIFYSSMVGLNRKIVNNTLKETATMFDRFQPLKALLHKSAFTHSHTKGRWLLHKDPTYSSGTHTHTFTHQWCSNLGFSILLKDTSTCRPETLGIKPPTFWLTSTHSFSGF